MDETKKEVFDTKRIIKLIIGFLPLLLLFVDPPEGMDPKAWGLFPFYAGAILMVMLQPVGEATALLIFLGLYAVIKNGQAVSLSGFSLAMTWLVVGAYVIAQAFADTNLGRRISFWMIRIFGRTTLGLGYAAAFADFIIAPVTPSNAARTGGIIWPIFQQISVSLGSTPDKNPRGIGAYLSMIAYTSSWEVWTTAFIVPAGVVLLIAPYVMYKIYKPTITKVDNIRIAKEGLDAIGPMSGKEKLLLGLFVLAIIAVCKWVVPKVYDYFDNRRKVKESQGKVPASANMLVLAIIVCLAMSAFAEWIGLAAIIGAFLAGMLFADHAWEWDLEHKIDSITSFLLPFFFLNVGMQVNIFSLSNGSVALLAVVAIVLALISKYIGCGIGAKIGDRTIDRQSFNIIGVGMMPRGEVGIIIATIGLGIVVNGERAMSEELYTVVVLMSVITTIIAPPILAKLFRKKYHEEYTILPEDRI